MTGPAADKYDLTALLGRGPHGEIWRAHRLDTGEELAVKLLHDRYARDRDVLDAMNAERHTLIACPHPAFVPVRELVFDDQIALVTELIHGRDLDRRGPLPPEVVLIIAGAVADALAAAHTQDVVHCDIKPANLLLTAVAKEVRITDSGLAYLLRGHRAGAGRFADYRYAAPEIIRGTSPAPATDVYGLGLVLFEILTGETFVDADESPGERLRNLRDLRLGYRASVARDIAHDCLAVDPADRPTAAELAAWIRQLRRSFGDEPRRGRSDADSPASAVRIRPVDDDVVVPATPFPPAAARPRTRRRRADIARRPGRRATVVLTGRWRPSRRLLVLVVAVLIGLPTAVVLNGLLTSGGGQPVTGDIAEPPGIEPIPEASLMEPPTAATRAGAAAFVRYWFDALNYAAETGDPEPLQASSSPACKACGAAMAMIRTAYNNGGYLDGGQYELHSVVVNGSFTVQRPTFDVVFDRSARLAMTGNGRLVSVLPGATSARCQVLLERTADGWRVLEGLSDKPIA
jgi:Protein kinase domain/Family of unknown function (DUF6318)